MKNSTPSSEFEHEDKCPSCGSPCNIHTDLDANDNCNECRDQIDTLEMGQIITKEEPKTFKELFANTGIKPTTDENGNIQYNFKATMKKEPKLTNVCIKCGVDLYYVDNFACQEHPKNCKGIHLSEETLKERALKEEPKQETLEKASNIAVQLSEHLDAQEQAFFIAGFQECIKWQQQQNKNLYSEKDIMNALHSVELKYNRDFTKIYEGVLEYLKQITL